jgi:hypothetical protein
MNHLSRAGRISGSPMHGMMAKNVLADLSNGKYQGIGNNVDFIVGGQGFAKVVEAASINSSSSHFFLPHSVHHPYLNSTSSHSVLSSLSIPIPS